MSVQLGLWSYPNRAIFNEFLDIHTLALPEILGRHGYHRVWLTGSDPSIDNMQPWVQRWYDRWELLKQDDLALVRRLLELYRAAPPGQPRLMSLYTVTMHPPYRVPASWGPPLRDPDAAYQRALRFTDAALGELFDALRRTDRWNDTFIAVVGDHGRTVSAVALGEDRLAFPNWPHAICGDRAGPDGDVCGDTILARSPPAGPIIGRMEPHGAGEEQREQEEGAQAPIHGGRS